ncbi:hypothetical protein MMC15_001814, partial [Xylographa vitiligo]|nr:hypothetical protein [Xylographa vitiligo]
SRNVPSGFAPKQGSEAAKRYRRREMASAYRSDGSFNQPDHLAIMHKAFLAPYPGAYVPEPLSFFGHPAWSLVSLFRRL